MRLSIALAAAVLILATGSTARAQDVTPTTAVTGPLGEPAAIAPSKAPVDVVRRFYDAFEKGDFTTLEQIYSPDVHWQDTIFSYDGRANVMGVWRFEIDPSKGGKISYKILSTEGNKVVVSWVDDYSFFGNQVSHAITATLTVENGQITNHVEDYSWDEWAKQAFAFKDLDLGKFATTPAGKVVMEGALRAFVYTYVPAMNLYAAVSSLVAKAREKVMGEDKDAAKGATAPEVQPPRTGMSELLQRRMAEGSHEDSRPGAEGR